MNPARIIASNIAGEQLSGDMVIVSPLNGERSLTNVSVRALSNVPDRFR
jgi:hypothetical protein